MPRKKMMYESPLYYQADIEALERTVKWFKKQIEPQDCGWMYTTIDGLKERIKFLRKEINKCRGK